MAVERTGALPRYWKTQRNETIRLENFKRFLGVKSLMPRHQLREKRERERKSFYYKYWKHDLFCAKLKRHHCLLALSLLYRLISLVQSTTRKKWESKINLRDGKDDGREIMHRRRNTVKESLLTYLSATSSITQKREGIPRSFPSISLVFGSVVQESLTCWSTFLRKKQNKEKCLNYSIVFLLLLTLTLHLKVVQSSSIFFF